MPFAISSLHFSIDATSPFLHRVFVTAHEEPYFAGSTWLADSAAGYRRWICDGDSTGSQQHVSQVLRSSASSIDHQLCNRTDGFVRGSGRVTSWLAQSESLRWFGTLGVERWVARDLYGNRFAFGRAKTGCCQLDCPGGCRATRSIVGS